MTIHRPSNAQSILGSKPDQTSTIPTVFCRAFFRGTFWRQGAPLFSLALGGVAVLGALEKSALGDDLGLGAVALHDEVVIVVEAEADVVVCDVTGSRQCKTAGNRMARGQGKTH